MGLHLMQSRRDPLPAWALQVKTSSMLVMSLTGWPGMRNQMPPEEYTHGQNFHEWNPSSPSSPGSNAWWAATVFIYQIRGVAMLPKQLHPSGSWDNNWSFFPSLLHLREFVFKSMFFSSLGDDPFLASSSYCYSHSWKGWTDQVFYPKQGTNKL